MALFGQMLEKMTRRPWYKFFSENRGRTCSFSSFWWRNRYHLIKGDRSHFCDSCSSSKKLTPAPEHIGNLHSDSRLHSENLKAASLLPHEAKYEAFYFAVQKHCWTYLAFSQYGWVLSWF